MKKRPVTNFKNIPFWLALLFLLPSLFLNAWLYSKYKSTTLPGIKVIGIIDGDTLVLDGKVRLRLRQIDAPELEFCGGPQAKQLLEKMVDGKSIVIKEQILDQQGRAMALIYIGNLLINEELLKSGWVRYHHDQTSQASQLKKVSEQAKQNQKGIFSPLCYQTTNPDNPKCVIKANIDKSTGEKIYFLPGCPQYNFTIVEKDIGESWFCTEKEAQQVGFRKAKNC